ncbi:hypothetical protein ACXM0N_16065 [Peribacillus simplex]
MAAFFLWNYRGSLIEEGILNVTQEYIELRHRDIGNVKGKNRKIGEGSYK